MVIIQLVGNTGAWKDFREYDSYRRYKYNDSGYAAQILNQPMPDRLAIKLGS